MRLRQILSLIFLTVSLGLVGWVVYFLSSLYTGAVRGNCSLTVKLEHINKGSWIQGDQFAAAVIECTENYYELHLRVVVWSMLGLVVCVSFFGVLFFLYNYQGNKKKNT